MACYPTKITITLVVLLVMGCADHQNHQTANAVKNDFIDQSTRTTNASSNDSNEKGRLSVQTRPWAFIYVDGELVSKTPVVDHELAPGKHIVTAKPEEAGLEKDFEVIIKPGQTTMLIKTLDISKEMRQMREEYLEKKQKEKAADAGI